MCRNKESGGEGKKGKENGEERDRGGKSEFPVDLYKGTHITGKRS